MSFLHGVDPRQSPTCWMSPKINSLSLSRSLQSNHSAFHTVKGVKRRGLLIDPGAAAGLVGSETLRDILKTCFPDRSPKDAVWSDSDATITGISGQPDKALGRVHLSCQIGENRSALINVPLEHVMSSDNQFSKRLAWNPTSS